jgi:FAD/FMN-containing dehydrogenase
MAIDETGLRPGTTGAAVDEGTVENLAAGFRGELVQPGDARYDQARSVFNGMIDRRPAIVARCTGVADVVAAVNFARDSGLVVAVRSGGHSLPGYGVCDGGIVIDLSPMKGMWVDPVAQTARAQTGLTWGEFDRETQMFGLATTGGRMTTTGIGGQTLGSGSGWLERKFGLTLDNLLSAELVTAAGEVVRASDSENPELFWGLRGGGGNFGVVTSLEYRLHPLGPIVLGGVLLHRAERAGEVLRFWRDYVDTAPDELGTLGAFISAPPEPFVPDDLQGRPVVAIAVCWSGSIEDGEQALRPLREFGPPVVDVVQPMPYTAVQGMFDGAFPRGIQNYWKAENMDALSDGAVDVLVERAAMMTSPASMLFAEPKGRAISRVKDDETALGGREAALTLFAFSLWENPAETDEHLAWTRETMAAMRAFTTSGVSMNFTSDQPRDMVKASFGGPLKYERLVDLKTAYDPANLFHLNQNIEPRT